METFVVFEHSYIPVYEEQIFEQIHYGRHKNNA